MAIYCRQFFEGTHSCYYSFTHSSTGCLLKTPVASTLFNPIWSKKGHDFSSLRINHILCPSAQAPWQGLVQDTHSHSRGYEDMARGRVGGGVLRPKPRVPSVTRCHESTSHSLLSSPTSKFSHLQNLSNNIWPPTSKSWGSFYWGHLYMQSMVHVGWSTGQDRAISASTHFMDYMQ